jgi:hypothetical protein
MSANDFENAEKFIAAGRRYAVTTLEHEALLEIAVIRYARPFTGNEIDECAGADARIAVEPAKVLLAADIPLHERIITLRHKVIAHSESAQNPVGLIEPGMVVSRRWHIVNEKLDLEAFSRIANAMKVHSFNIVADLRRSAPNVTSGPRQAGLA